MRSQQSSESDESVRCRPLKPLLLFHLIVQILTLISRNDKICLKGSRLFCTHT